jgi:nucleoside-diphosphate-sugar epimerase
MKVLFIGGTGTISEAVSRLTIEKGIELYLLNRGTRNELVPEGARLITGDIRKPQEVADAIKDLYFDTVVDWIAFNPGHIAADLELFRGKTDQYMFISSASAYQKPSSHYLVNESTPLANPFWQYSRDKIACEENLNNEYRNNGFPVTIIRPSLTYGSTMIPASLNSWSQPWSLVDRMRKGKKIIVQGDGNSFWTMTHNSDFAKGITGLFGNTGAIGHAFNITSDEVLTWNQIYEAIGRAAGVKPDIIHIPSDFIVHMSPAHYGGVLGDKSVGSIFDNSKIKRFVPGFAATVPFGQGVEKSVKWFEAHPERCTVDVVWEQLMDRIIEKYSRIFD